MLLYYSLAAGLPLLTLSTAQIPSSIPGTDTGTYPAQIEGTWSTKSRSTLTGPNFYDPFSEEFTEPDHTGISYSFTDNGYYEEAYYRAISNPADPACPSGLIQWQHGQYTYWSNGSLSLAPIDIDGRQLISTPCMYDNSIYTRYNQTELFQRFSQYTDPYHNVPRLDLYQFNGAPLQPLYLVYNPPQMLPTTTLHPATSSASATAGSKLRKRGMEPEVPINWKAKLEGTQQGVFKFNADRLWWIGLGMTGLGGLLYLGPRRMGIQL